MNALIQPNLHYLSQAEHLLRQLEDQTFAQPAKGFYDSTIGGHLRHCLDHYDSFLNGLEDGKVDYDHRVRLPELETQTQSALTKVLALSETLKNLSSQSPPVGLLIKMDCGSATIDWQPSTLGRELQFLVSHTVHHFAMIGGICKELGIELESGFGVAPSTLRHQAETTA